MVGLTLGWLTFGFCVVDIWLVDVWLTSSVGLIHWLVSGLVDIWFVWLVNWIGWSVGLVSRLVRPSGLTLHLFSWLIGLTGCCGLTFVCLVD